MMGFKTGANLENFVWAVLSHSVPIVSRQGTIHFGPARIFPD